MTWSRPLWEKKVSRSNTNLLFVVVDELPLVLTPRCRRCNLNVCLVGFCCHSIAINISLLVLHDSDNAEDILHPKNCVAEGSSLLCLGADSQRVWVPMIASRFAFLNTQLAQERMASLVCIIFPRPLLTYQSFHTRAPMLKRPAVPHLPNYTRRRIFRSTQGSCLYPLHTRDLAHPRTSNQSLTPP